MQASMHDCSLQFWFEMHVRISEQLVPLDAAVAPLPAPPSPFPEEDVVDVALPAEQPATAERESEKTTEARRRMFMSFTMRPPDDWAMTGEPLVINIFSMGWGVGRTTMISDG